MLFCTVHWKLSDLFSIWCLVSQVFLCTHFLQPEPQYKHDTTHCFQRYRSQQNDLLLECPSKNCVCLVSFADLLWLSLHHARCLEQQHSFCQTSSYQCTMQEEFFYHCQRHGEQTFLLYFLNFWFLLVYLCDVISLYKLWLISFLMPIEL